MTAATLLRAIDFESVAQFSSARILNCAVEGIGIALLAWVLLRVLGRQNSGTRFAVWFAALLGIAALPLFGHGDVSGAALARRPEFTLPASWALYMLAGWSLLAAVGLFRVGIGLWQVRRLRKNCAPIDVAALAPLLRKTLQEFDSRRPVTICVSDALPVPTAIGFMRPLVIIPSWTMGELSAVELNAILLHELAHLRRWDDWTNLVQKVLGALFFFHPAVWWIEKKLALEREMACDDLVLAKTASPRVYAECLVSLAEILAEKSLLRRGFALAQAAVGRVRHISLRVAQILDEKRPGATRVWRPAPGLLMGISLACLTALSDAPRLVSFGDSSPVSVTVPAAAVSAEAMEPESREAGQISRAGSQVIPASFLLKPEARPRAYGAARIMFPAARTTAARTKTAPGKSAVVPARAVQQPAPPPRLVRSSLTEESPIPQTLIFIMRTGFLQTGPDDPSGAVVWRYCVWQVMVLGPARNGMEPEIIVKAI
jgi:bla regulator protein blaR1